MSDSTEVNPPPPGSPRDRDNRFYQHLAGGARTRVMETFLDLQLPELLSSTGPMSASAICEQLALHPHRGWKFLHLASLCGLLQEEHGYKGQDEALYSLSEDAIEFFGEDGKGGYFFRDLINYWRRVAYLPTVEVLRGMPLPDAVEWPPKGLAAAEHLETWMRITAEGAIKSILSAGALDGARSMLDVGGGDGTIGCSLVKQIPDLDVTVFNLPASAYLARQNILANECTEKVKIHEGNFLEDDLPGGFDRVCFNRVLADWTPEVCLMLFDKSRAALNDGGRLVINEPLNERNMDCAVAWEFRYVFYDTFGRGCFKSLETYKQLLAEKGFEVVKVTPMEDEIYTVIESVPV